MLTNFQIEIIATILVGHAISLFIRAFIDMFKGYSEIQTITNENIPAIKLVNMQFSQESPAYSFFHSILATVTCGFVCYVIVNYRYDLYCLVAFALLLAVSLIDFYRIYLYFKYGEFAYFTPTSLATISKVYKKDKYHFVIENKTTKAGDTETYLSIYRHKTILRSQPTFSGSFKIIENTEAVVRIVNDYYM